MHNVADRQTTADHIVYQYDPLKSLRLRHFKLDRMIISRIIK